MVRHLDALVLKTSESDKKDVERIRAHSAQWLKNELAEAQLREKVRLEISIAAARAALAQR